MAITFRKKSLEKLSSPEELDSLLTITSPMVWAALITIGFCLVAAVAWGIYGRVPTKLSGSGILLNPKGIFSVKAQTSGSVKTVKTELGQKIKEGEVLVVLNYPEQEEEVKAAQTDLAELEAEYQRQQREEARTLREKKQERDLAVQELELNIEISQSKVARLNQRIQNQKELLDMGLITQYDLADTVEERDTAKDRIETDLSQKAVALDTFEQAKSESEAKLRDLEKQIVKAKETLAEKQALLKTDELIFGPYDGIVVAVATEPGARVNAGDELVTIDLVKGTTEKELVCRQYYPAASAKRIQKGMMTQVAPGTVEVDQYGYLLAKVTLVAEFPSTVAELQNELQNDELVKGITSMGPVLAVESVLLKDQDTPSGYKWTSSQGPPYALDNGTPCTTSVIIEEIPPVSLVVPMLKKYLLGIGEEQS